MLFVSSFLQRRGRQAAVQSSSSNARQPTVTSEPAAASGNDSSETKPFLAAASIPDVAPGSTGSAAVDFARVEPGPPAASAVTAAPDPTPVVIQPGRQAARVVPQPPRERVPIGARIMNMGGAIERFMIRHRTSSALLFAYCSFFWRLYGEVDKLGAMAPGPVPTEMSPGTMLFDPDTEAPLTRALVMSRMRLSGSSGRKAGAGLRRESAGKLSDEDADRLESEDDPMAVLEGALRLAASKKDPLVRAELLAESYGALGRIHSARGYYYEMLHAMSLALRASADAGDSQAVCNLQITLGHLEIKHHRYYAAGTRFEDALQTCSSSNATDANTTRAEALAGLGWAAVVQGGGELTSGRFLEALGWMPAPASSRLSVSAAAAAAVTAASREGCRAHGDGLDGTRALSLAGISLASIRHDSGAGAPAILLECAVSLFQGMPAELQGPHVWGALGLARHALSEKAAAKRYHQRAALRERREPSLPESSVGAFTCANAADLPSCSHNALQQGLVDFAAGNVSLGVGHVDLLLSRTGAVAVEAAEWLTRFARAHAWAPSGRDFASMLLGRVEPLLKSEGDARLARHFVEYGRFLLAHKDRPARLKRALTQLSRARTIVERVDVGWTDTEVATLHSTMGTAQSQLGEIEDAAISFEKALKYDRRSAATGNKPNHKRLLLSHANLGALRLQLAGTDPRRWRVALADLKDGRRVARQAGLSILDPIMQELEASYHNAMRLAHHRGMLASCPGPLVAFLYGPSCSIDSDAE